jgi:hypothetical protein
LNFDGAAVVGGAVGVVVASPGADVWPDGSPDSPSLPPHAEAVNSPAKMTTRRR